MSAIFAGVFATLWVYQPKSSYLCNLALCYLGQTIGFTLLALPVPVGMDHVRAVANLTLLLSCICLAVAFFQRCKIPFRLTPFAAITAVAFGVFLWFLYVEPNVVARIYIINGGTAAMMAVCVALTFGSLRTKADWVASALMAIMVVLSVARPMLTLPIDNLAPDSAIALSNYWMVFSFSHAIMSLVLVFAFTTGFAIDAMRELEDMSLIDPLSGLLNRRGFEQAARKQIVEAHSRKLPFCLILCDLDHFKSVNDNFGHHVGDSVIILFAQTMRQVVGDRHIVGRIGGEEFGILVSGGDRRVAELLAQGIRTGFSATGLEGSRHSFPTRTTASFGVAELAYDEDYEGLAKRADKALYKAKGDGRDCVRGAPIEPFSQYYLEVIDYAS